MVQLTPWYGIGLVLFISNMKYLILMCHCYLKIFSKQLLLNMWSLPLSFVVSEYAGVVEITSSGGSRRFKTTHQAVTRTPTTGQQSFQEVEICRTWCPCQGATTIPTPAASMGTEGTKCQPMATSHRDTHTRWEHSQAICGIYPDGTKIPAPQVDMLIWWRGVILDEKMPSSTKGNKCEDRCTHSTSTSV